LSATPPQHPPTAWTIKALLDWTASYFGRHGLPTPRLDGELLLAHVLGCTRLDLYLRFDQPLTPAELAAFRALVRARAGRTPVAYLVGEVGFWNLTLAIRPGCLIPRPDTETLVEVALEAIAALRGADAAAPLAVAELGPGSGAVPLALCSEVEGLTWVAVELAPAALAVAAENRRRHAALLAPRRNALHLVRGRGLSVLAPGWRPHLVVSNPPYIPSADIDGLAPEVARAEPRVALDGGPDGLALHRELLAWAARQLPPGGRLLLEMGYDQEPTLRALAAELPALRVVEVRRDLAGHPRVLHAERTAAA